MNDQRPPRPINLLQMVLDEIDRLKAEEAAAARLLLWRVGRKVRRTIYRQVGPEPSDDDVLIGVMDTAELAAEVVAARNEVVAAWVADA